VNRPPPLPASDLEFTFVRAAGPGGQNVNKVASAAQLRFDLTGTACLDAASKARLRALAGHRLTAAGDILIVARTHRTQEGNRRAALERLEELVARARIVPKLRRATRPTRGANERRIAGKLHQQHTKRLRRQVRGED
jgi:ribosome-associated protein